MSWIVPENKLDPQQQDFIDKMNFEQKNIWIKGFPGSGKSVLLAYTIKKIKRQHSDAKIILVVFTRSLIAMFRAAFAEMGLSVSIVTFYEFMDSSQHYDYVLSDEVQDLVPSVLREMNKRADHVIVCGDENQSIFESDPKYREATVKPYQISSLLSAENYELRIIHRLTRNIITVVERFLPNMHLFAAKTDSTKVDTQVRICEADSLKEEAQYILKQAKSAINVGQTAGILVPTQEAVLSFISKILESEGKPQWKVTLNSWGKADYNDLNHHLSNHSIPLQYVGNGYGNFDSESRKITLMTYHSSKGLDFDNVFLPGLSNSLFINRNETLSKTLFMVAMTRSRNNLYLVYNGYRHAYLSNFSADCHHINVHDVLNNRTTTGSGNVFGI